MFIGTILAEQEKIKSMSAETAAGQVITNVLVHIYKENILTEDALAPLALLLLNGNLTRIAAQIPGQAIINVRVIGFRDKKFPEDVLIPVVMKILNGLITKIALTRGRHAVIANV